MEENGEREENYELNDPIARLSIKVWPYVTEVKCMILCSSFASGVTLTDESGGLTGSVQEMDLMMRISVPAQFRFYLSR